MNSREKLIDNLFRLRIVDDTIGKDIRSAILSEWDALEAIIEQQKQDIHELRNKTIIAGETINRWNKERAGYQVEINQLKQEIADRKKENSELILELVGIRDENVGLWGGFALIAMLAQRMGVDVWRDK